MTEFPEDIKSAFREYRLGHPDPEPSVNFTPMLWQAIESRRMSMSSVAIMRRLTHGLVAMAMAAALVLGIFVIPQMQDSRDLTHSYAEVVAHDDEETSEREIVAAFAVPVAHTPVAHTYEADER